MFTVCAWLTDGFRTSVIDSFDNLSDALDEEAKYPFAYITFKHHGKIVLLDITPVDK